MTKLLYENVISLAATRMLFLSTSIHSVCQAGREAMISSSVTHKALKRGLGLVVTVFISCPPNLQPIVLENFPYKPQFRHRGSSILIQRKQATLTKPVLLARPRLRPLMHDPALVKRR